MQRIRYKLTLWWRTLTRGPMCQRCESRHHRNTREGAVKCTIRIISANLETEHLMCLRGFSRET